MKRDVRMHVRCCFIPRLRSSKLGLPGIKQQRLTFVRRFIVVIRLGFEPKTHSLEGCCSIQLSYRTDPYLLLDSEGLRSKVAAKIVIIFGFAILRRIFCDRDVFAGVNAELQSYSAFLRAMILPTISMPVTRKKPMRAKRIACP